MNALFIPDIVCIIETWLDQSISDTELALERYSVVHLDRNRHGGDILLFFKSSYCFDVVLTAPRNLELLVVTIHSYSSI